MVLELLPFSIILFILGFVFGFMIMKWQIEIFLANSISLGIGNILDISRLISSVLIVSAFMGIAFQFPIILLLLMRIGIVTNKQIAAQRLWVYLGSFIFAVLLPPDSILADILLTFPLIILFEGTLLLNRALGRRKPK
jgi:sec-independent protein translocase protein TatC